MTDANDNYRKLREFGVPDEYLNDRHYIVRMVDADRSEELIWVHEVDTNEVVWSSPATIA